MSKPIDFYLGLITSEYQNSPKFLALVQAFLEKLNDASTLADSLYQAFDIDSAVGVQLDKSGEIVGQSREVDFQPTYGLSPVLEDEIYRILLKATIGKNHWNGKQDGLNELWSNLFPNATIAIHDNHYMDMDVFILWTESVSSILLDLIQNKYIVPKPEGVLQRYYIGPPFPLFGFDYDDPYVAGFDIGNWWTPNYNKYPYFGFDTDDALLTGFDEGNWYSAIMDSAIQDELGLFITDENGNKIGDGWS